MVTIDPKEMILYLYDKILDLKAIIYSLEDMLEDGDTKALERGDYGNS